MWHLTPKLTLRSRSEGALIASPTRWKEWIDLMHFVFRLSCAVSLYGRYGSDFNTTAVFHQDGMHASNTLVGEIKMLLVHHSF